MRQALLRAGRQQDLAAVRRAGHPAGQVHGAPEHVAALAARRPAVQAHPDAERRIGEGRGEGGERLLDRHGARQGVLGIGEQHEEAVAEEGALLAAVQLDRRPDDRVVGAQDAAPALVADGLGQRGGAHDVREQERATGGQRSLRGGEERDDVHVPEA